MYYYLVIIAVVALDQVIKYLTVSNLYVNQSIPVIEDIIHITYIHNTGAAFSLFQEQKVLLLALPLVVIIAGIVYIGRHNKNRSKIMLLSISFIVGGGIGNLIDRFLNGYVVDMIDFRIFPIFNIADIFVSIGCALLFIYIIFLDGKKRGSK